MAKEDLLDLRHTGPMLLDRNPVHLGKDDFGGHLPPCDEQSSRFLLYYFRKYLVYPPKSESASWSQPGTDLTFAEQVKSQLVPVTKYESTVLIVPQCT